MDGITTHPRSGGVGTNPGQGDLEAHGALASRLDRPTSGLTEDGHFPNQQFGRLGEHLPEAVVDGGHLLPGIEHPGHVDGRLYHGAGQLQHHGQATLHVSSTQAPQGVPVDTGTGGIAGHRVRVTAQHEAVLPTQVGPGHQVVTDPVHGQARYSP